MSERFWDEKMETLPRDVRLALRDHRVRWQVRRSWDNSPFYRARLGAAGVTPDAFNGLADLRRIPILHPEDLPPPTHAGEASLDWAVAPVEWWQGQDHGPSGRPRALTEGDLTYQAHLAARALWAAGARPDCPASVVVNADGSVQNAIKRGAERAGITLRTAAGEHDALTPAVVWQPAWPEHEHRLGGLTIPAVAATIAYACSETGGLHWADDHFLIEIVDPSSGHAVRTGESGAIVVTDITREGSPLIRYWTGLEAVLLADGCSCGRTSARSPWVRPIR